MKRISLLLLLLLQAYLCLAQTKGSFIVTGRVADTDNVPLINATVLDINSQSGTTTNKQGIFTFKLPKQATTIRLSYIGYHTLETAITTDDIENAQNDTIWLPIELTPKITELSGVEIRAASTYLAYDQPNTRIIDFDFHPDGLLLLISVDNQFQLRLVDEDSYRLDEITLRKNPEKLYRDCFGNVHILYADSTYQITADAAELSLMQGFPIEKFNAYLLPCVAASSENLFFKDYGKHNQAVVYYRLEKSSKQQHLVREIVDQESLVAVDDFYRENRAQSRRARDVMAENNIIQQRFARKVERKFWFYEDVLSSPTYNPLIELRDSLFIFNHIVDSVFVHTQEGDLKRTFPVDHHYQTGWKNELIPDYEKEAIYAKCIRGGLVYLLRINPNSGEVISESRLSGHIYPENIKVRNGYAYYLYVDHTASSGTQNVYKQPIE